MPSVSVSLTNGFLSVYCSFPEPAFHHIMSCSQPTLFSILEVFRCFQPIHRIGELIMPLLIVYLYPIVLIASVWMFTFNTRNDLFKLDPQHSLHISENSSCVLP